MIAKCSIIVLLATVAYAHSGCQTVVASVTDGASSGSSSNTAVVRNYVAKGKYPVALENCGPTPDRQIPVSTSYSTAPVQEKPTIRKASNLPAPRVINHSCTCYKTIVRPRVHQHIVTVPTVQRYVETSHRPVVENYVYEAVPVNCGQREIQAVEVPVSSSQSGESVQVSRVQAIEVPQVRAIEVPQVQTIEVPRVQTVEIPRVQTIEIPRVQTVEVPRVQTVEIPRVQTVEIPQIRTVEVPRVQTIEVPQLRTVEVPRVQTIEVPQVQTVQVSQLQSYQTPQYSCRSC